MHQIDVFSSYVLALLHIHNSILLLSQPGQGGAPDFQEEALVQCEPGEGSDCGPRFSFSAGIQSNKFMILLAYTPFPDTWFVPDASTQELQKYLRGYHDCTLEEMKNLGGLLFRTQVDSDRSQFVMIPRMLRLLVPADQIKITTPEEWKKVTEGTYRGRTVTDWDEAFAWLGCPLLSSLLPLPLSVHHLLLQQAEWHDSAGGQSRIPENHFKMANIRLCLLWGQSESSGWTDKQIFKEKKKFCHLCFDLHVTFQQTYESSYPNVVLFVISKQGVSFTDPKTKVHKIITFYDTQTFHL